MSDKKLFVAHYIYKFAGSDPTIDIIGIFETKIDAQSACLIYLCRHFRIFYYLFDTDFYPNGFEDYKLKLKCGHLKQIFVNDDCIKKFKDIVNDEENLYFPFHLIKPKYQNFEFLCNYNIDIWADEWDCEIKEVKLTKDSRYNLGCNIKHANKNN